MSPKYLPNIVTPITIKINSFNKQELNENYNLLITPVHFIASDKVPDYCIEIIDSQKLRLKILKEII